MPALCSSFVPLFGVLIPLFLIVIASAWKTSWFYHTTICSMISILGFLSTFHLIPSFAITLKKKGLAGKDLNKLGEATLIPESLGLVAATVFIICAISCQLLFSDDPSKLLEYNSGLVAICFMTFLGFTDDVIDLRWRYKVILPVAAALPLVMAYHGSTTVKVPSFLQLYIGTKGLVDLGSLYRIYMGLLTIFCTNSINIYAGINGLEVGQSLVMSASVITHNLLSLHHTLTLLEGTSDISSAAMLQQKLDQNFFSLLLSLPFFACSSALLWYNWYPSQVFVGDTFTYFAGVYFAVVGILGHSSKTLLLFFIPQIFNFILSVPQLLQIVPCPRHRVPKINQKTGLLEPSPNLTLINFVLQLTGPLREDYLCILLLTIQAFSCSLGLWFHYRYLI